MLEGFRPINLTVGLPYISITKNGVTFNKTSIVKIGKPAYVLLMMDDVNKRIAVQPCDSSDEDATAFFKGEGKSVVSVRWNNKDLLNTLSKMMNYDLDKFSYRVDGDYLSNENALIFDLKLATILGEKE
jgi:hypothetical protein